MQADQRGGEAAPVGDVRKDGARRLVQALVEDAIAHGLQVGLVLPAHELLQRAHVLRLGVRIYQLRVHLA